MSAACQCDRCGKMYPYIYNSKDPNAFTFANVDYKREWTRSGTVFDLCPDCFNELGAWLANKKETE